jgi:hypothetical protein
MRFRATALSLATCLVLAGVVSPGGARPVVDEAYFASDNIEVVGTVPLDGPSGGARIVGDRLYVTTSFGLTIFDISEPVSPRELGNLEIPLDAFHFSPEDVDTNGEVLIIRAPLPSTDLYVIDVRDPASPTLVATVPEAGAHTMSCVFDCAYAFGNNGVVVDLNPMEEAHVIGSWNQGTRMYGAQTHDVTEIRPGILLTASEPAFLIDARRDLSPSRIVAVGPMPEGIYAHGSLWPREGRDRFVLVGTENDGPPRCGELERGELMVFDASRWVRGGVLELKDTYRVNGGVFVDGRAPVNTACGHWFDAHPRFSNGGLVAMAWYEHGVRLLSVESTGKMEEIGYFVPADGSTSAAYWVTDELVYATDYNGRGIDILRIRSSS